MEADNSMQYAADNDDDLVIPETQEVLSQGSVIDLFDSTIKSNDMSVLRAIRTNDVSVISVSSTESQDILSQNTVDGNITVANSDNMFETDDCDEFQQTISSQTETPEPKTDATTEHALQHENNGKLRDEQRNNKNYKHFTMGRYQRTAYTYTIELY